MNDLQYIPPGCYKISNIRIMLNVSGGLPIALKTFLILEPDTGDSGIKLLNYQTVSDN